VVVDASNSKILGASVVGPQASVLVQLVVDLMNAGDGTFYPLGRAQIIHPALSEVVVRAFSALQHPGGHGHDHGGQGAHGDGGHDDGGHDNGEHEGHDHGEGQGQKGPRRKVMQAKGDQAAHGGNDHGHDHGH
jgi:hypothetical protein